MLFIKRQSRVQNFCFKGLHPLFFSNINIFFNTFFTKNFFKSVISINNAVITNQYLYYSCRTVGFLHKMSLKG